MSFNSISSKRLIKLFLFFSFLICWLSVSTSFEDLLIFQKSQQYDYDDLFRWDLNNVINFLRHFLVYFCFFLLILLILLFRKDFFSKKNIIFHFYLGYLIAQIPGLLYSNNSIENISYVISSLTITLTVIFVIQFFSSKEKRIFTYLSFLVLLGVFSSVFIPHFIDFLKGGDYFYGFFLGTEILFDKPPPRSSGLARTSLILLLLTHIIESFIFKGNKTIYKIIKITFLTCIFLFQSRTILFLILFYYLFIFIFENKISIKNFIKFTVTYFIIPLILVNLLSTFNTYQKLKYDKVLNKEGDKISPTLLNVWMQNYDKKENIRSVKTGDLSSGRFEDWRAIFNKTINEKKILLFGYGSQADRYLINQTASNGMVYAFSSSGIIGIICFIFFSLLAFYQSFKVLLKSYKNDLDFYIYSLIIMMILLRSILETSYAVFSIDFIIIITILGKINDIKVDIREIKLKYF